MTKLLPRIRVHLSIYPNSVFNGFFNQFWFLKRIIWSCITKDLWSCYLRMAFRDGDNFCKAFAGALVHMSYHSWLRHLWYDKCTCAPSKALQKLSPCQKTTYHRKCQHRGGSGQKKQKSCQRSFWTTPLVIWRKWNWTIIERVESNYISSKMQALLST